MNVLSRANLASGRDIFGKLNLTVKDTVLMKARLL